MSPFVQQENKKETLEPKETYLADPMSSLLFCMRWLVMPVGVGLRLSSSLSTSTMLPAQESTSSSAFSSTLQSSSSEVLDAAEEFNVAEFLSPDCVVTGDEFLWFICKRKESDQNEIFVGFWHFQIDPSRRQLKFLRVKREFECCLKKILSSTHSFRQSWFPTN